MFVNMNSFMKMVGQMGVPALLGLALATGVFHNCSSPALTQEERGIIMNQDSLMQVMVMPTDSTVLRRPSRDLEPNELHSPELRTLIDKMLYTVQHPSQDGVGIAAPQVGINRRIVCVQRFDKPGEPFEYYLNVRIDSLGGERLSGPEGCLSVPGLRGLVTRNSLVHISYADKDSGHRISETVQGYSAVIFQHECDHLDGILYTDKADTVFVVPSPEPVE